MRITGLGISICLLASACGASGSDATSTDETTPPTTPATEVSTTVATTEASTTSAPVTTSLETSSTTQSITEEEAYVAAVVEGLVAFNGEVDVLTAAMGVTLDEDERLDLSLNLCSLLRSGPADEIDLLLLEGVLASRFTSRFVVSPFTVEMADLAEGIVGSAAENICNEEATAAFEVSRAKVLFQGNERRFLLWMHSAGIDEALMEDDATLLALGRSACDGWGNPDAEGLLEASDDLYFQGDRLGALTVLYAGAEGSLCPEHATVVSEAIELLYELEAG